MFALLAATFSLIGLGLVLGHQNDRRAAWLGGMLTLVGCPLASPLFASPLTAGGAAGPFWWLIHIRPEAFLGAFVWEGISAAGIATGVYLAAASLLAIWTRQAWRPPPLLAVANRPSVFFWPVLLGVIVPAFFVLLWRARTAAGADRRRVQVFVGALLPGLLPFAMEVFVEGVWPAYWAFVHAPSVEPWAGALLFSTLASLPFATAYSVLFDRVVSVRIVLQKALQYALARYTIIALTLVENDFWDRALPESKAFDVPVHAGARHAELLYQG